MKNKNLTIVNIDENILRPDPDFIDKFPPGYGEYHEVLFELHHNNKNICGGYFIKVDKGIANNRMEYSIDYVLIKKNDNNKKEIEEIHHVFVIDENTFNKVDKLIKTIDTDNVLESMDKLFGINGGQ